MHSVVVRVWLPDRPGALGQVASRIGSVGGDVVGIEILERGGGSAIDELRVVLPDPGLLDMLISEIHEVDGVAVEDVRPEHPGRPDASIAALRAASMIAESAADERLVVLCEQVCTLFDVEWAAAVRDSPPSVLVSRGETPDIDWLVAFLEGSRHLDGHGESTPSDLAWAHLGTGGAAIVVGRRTRPFHTREREQLALLARLTGALVTVDTPAARQR